jgi:hypothetical protein
MKNLEIVKDIIPADWLDRPAADELDQVIHRIVKRLEPAQAALIDTSKVNGHSFVNKVYELRNSHELPRTIYPSRRKKGLFLVKRRA